MHRSNSQKVPTVPSGKLGNGTGKIDFLKRKGMRRWMTSKGQINTKKQSEPEDSMEIIEQPFYQTLLRDLMASGSSMVADEINNLLRKEERDRKSSRAKTRMPPVKLIDQPDILRRIAYTLKLEQTLLQEGKKESAMLICKQLADAFFLQDRNIWLARHFYLAVLNRCRKICPKTTDRLQAEIHCLLAYIARENNESLESALAIAIDHLAVSRALSRDQNWQFKPNTILIKLKRPIAFYGVSSDDVYEVVDACTMSLYMIASLLEHELLISLANQIMHSPHHKAPTDEDLKNAHEFADLALQLALEVRQPVALSSALTRFGIVLRHVGAYEDAMQYFQQLQQHASLIGDPATEAIANHNMGICHIGMTNVTEALDCFARQRELVSLMIERELNGNAMHEIGHLLLQEGHLWEAEESYAIAHDDFSIIMNNRKMVTSLHQDKNQHRHHEGLDRCELAWAMYGVAAGQKLWSRFSGLCRSGKPADMKTLLQFKCGRKPLRPVARPNYILDDITTMNKPWDIDQASESKQTEDMPSSEPSWEEGFMFAAVTPDKKKLKKVEFDKDMVDLTFTQEIEETPEPQVEQTIEEKHLDLMEDEAIREMEAMQEEVNATIRELATTALRASQDLDGTYPQELEQSENEEEETTEPRKSGASEKPVSTPHRSLRGDSVDHTEKRLTIASEEE